MHIFTIIIIFKAFENKILEVIIKQGNSDSEVIICFGTKFKLSVDLIQLLKVITVLGFTSRHCHKLFVEEYLEMRYVVDWRFVTLL